MVVAVIAIAITVYLVSTMNLFSDNNNGAPDGFSQTTADRYLELEIREYQGGRLDLAIGSRDNSISGIQTVDLDSYQLQLTGIVRRNINQSDLFARWGGEEFVIILLDSQREEAMVVARRLQQIIAEHRFETAGQVTCSFGVAAFKNGDNLDTVLHRVDERLYLAKKLGKNRVE